MDCGHGWLAGRLSALGANIKEVEGSGELLRVAREWYPTSQVPPCNLTAGPHQLDSWLFDRPAPYVVPNRAVVARTRAVALQRVRGQPPVRQFGHGSLAVPATGTQVPCRILASPTVSQALASVSVR